jgi:hypothetical protein
MLIGSGGILGLLRCEALFENIEEIRLQSMPALFDEVGIVILAGGRMFWAREGGKAWRDMSAAYNFEALFGEGWYSKAEAGETLSANKSRLAEMLRLSERGVS